MKSHNPPPGKELHTVPYSFNATPTQARFIERARKVDGRKPAEFTRFATLERASRVLGEEIPS